MKDPTIPDLESLLETLGVSNEATWTEVQGRTSISPVARRQVEALLKLRDHFMKLKAQDEQALTQLREQLARAQHGGGQ